MHDEIKTITNWLGTGSINMFGRPFSGKDTQGLILADLFQGELIAGGDILRSHHDPEKINQILASGGIVPSDFYLGMVLPYLSQSIYDDKSLILSSVGRSHGEETAVLKATTDSGHPMKAVVVLMLSEAVVWQRFDAAQTLQDRGNRADDDRHSLENRLKEFQDKTAPVIATYKEHGLVIEVDGELPRVEVTGEIVGQLHARATR